MIEYREKTVIQFKGCFTRRGGEEERHPCRVLIGPVYLSYANQADNTELSDPLFLCRIRAPEILSPSPDAGGVSVEHAFKEAIEIVRLSLIEFDVFSLTGDQIKFSEDEFTRLC